MNEYETYRTYTALRAHFFTKSYDYFKYNKKIKIESYSDFQNRPDHSFFLKLSRQKDVEKFIVANFLKKQYWIKDLAYSEECQENYKNWEKKIISLTYNFKSDIIQVQNLKNDLKIGKNSHPKLLFMYLNKKISEETLLILLDACNYFEKWDILLKNDVIWDETSVRLKKYRPFLEYDQKKFKKIIFDHVNDHK